jgi:hypothetical protein
MDIVPIREVELSLHGIAIRALDQAPAFEAAFRLQERRQELPFRGGSLVRTGHLRDSLTQPSADGAIRQIHAQAAEFGTSVPYARAAAHKKRKPVLMNLVPELAELTMQYVLRKGEL